MFQDEFTFPEHVSDDLLIQLLDGELAARHATRAKLHLASCWVCRGRIQELEQTVQCFLEYRRLAVESIGEPQKWTGFRSRLDQQASQLMAKPQYHWRWWVAACAAAAGLGALMLTWPLWQAVPPLPTPAARLPLRVPLAPPVTAKSPERRSVRPGRMSSTLVAVEPGLIPGTPFLGDVTAHSSIARDGEGRIARLQEGQTTLILDPVANSAYVIDHERMVAEQMPLSLALQGQWAVLPRLTNLRRDEPPGSLFKIPEGFEVRPFKRKKIPTQQEEGGRR